MADIVCSRCGHPNPPGANFCSSCGAPIDSGEHHTTTMSYAVPPPSADDDTGTIEVEDGPREVGMLVVKRGPNTGSRFALDKDIVTAGRHPDSDVFLDDITVSRRHVEVARTGDSYVVRDVGSLNGTYVNRERVEEAALHDGDEVQIGAFKLVFLAAR
jgi:hypothetical protein